MTVNVPPVARDAIELPATGTMLEFIVQLEGGRPNNRWDSEGCRKPT